MNELEYEAYWRIMFWWRSALGERVRFSDLSWGVKN